MKERKKEGREGGKEGGKGGREGRDRGREGGREGEKEGRKRGREDRVIAISLSHYVGQALEKMQLNAERSNSYCTRSWCMLSQ